MPPRAALSTVAALVVVVAAACSGGGDSADDEVVDTSEPTSTTTTSTSTTTMSTSTSSTTATDDGGDTQNLTIYLPDTSGRGCTEVVAVERRVEPTRAVATSALEELFAGPTTEERRGGLGGPFGEATDGVLRSVHIEDSIAYVDLTPAVLEVENLSTSCLSGAFSLPSSRRSPSSGPSRRFAWP